MNNNCCFTNILSTIEMLQCQSVKCDDVPSTCDRPFLGNITQAYLYNTRPVTFYNSNNQLLTMPYSLNDAESTTSVFRVEKVNNCCVTCRCLAKNPDESSEQPYIATNSFFTLNTNCICCLSCLADTFVDCI